MEAIGQHWGDEGIKTGQEPISPRGRPDLDSFMGSLSPPPAAAPEPSAQSPSIQAPSCRSLSVHVPPGNSSCGRMRTQSPAPKDIHGDYGHLTYAEFHNPCRGRGCARKASRAAPKTRRPTLDAVDPRPNRDMDHAMGASEDLRVTTFTRPSSR